jgi:hypothetical protein
MYNFKSLQNINSTFIAIFNKETRLAGDGALTPAKRIFVAETASAALISHGGR